MKAVKKLTKTELNSLISAASKELEARKKSRALLLDIQKVFKKYGVPRNRWVSYLKDAEAERASDARRPRKVAKRNGSKVPPKYKCPQTNATWTGRGKAPKWVLDLCDTKNISLEAFKTDRRFTV